MFNWVKEDLSTILGHFHKIHSKLEVFIDRVNDDILEKKQQISSLEIQVSTHMDDLFQAATVKENLKKLLGM